MIGLSVGCAARFPSSPGWSVLWYWLHHWGWFSPAWGMWHVDCRVQTVQMLHASELLVPLVLEQFIYFRVTLALILLHR